MPIKKGILTADEFDKISDLEKRKYVGRKVDTGDAGFGIGIVERTDTGRTMVQVKATLCEKKHKKTIYLTSAWSNGDLANVYNKQGQYLGNLRDNVFRCPKCRSAAATFTSL